MPSTRFAVAVHALTVLGYLDKNGVRRTSSSQIAQSVNTNPVVIRTLLRSLKKAGLIESKEGKGGGVCLARPASQISLQDIFNAVEEHEGFLAQNENPHFELCPISRGMKKVFLSVTKEVDVAVSKVLGRRTLKQLIEKFS